MATAEHGDWRSLFLKKFCRRCRIADRKSSLPLTGKRVLASTQLSLVHQKSGALSEREQEGGHDLIQRVTV